MRIRAVVSAIAAIVLAVSVSPSFARQLAQNKAAETAPVKSTGGIIVATIKTASFRPKSGLSDLQGPRQTGIKTTRVTPHAAMANICTEDSGIQPDPSNLKKPYQQCCL